MQGATITTAGKTRFRLYAQPAFVPGYEKTELVELGPSRRPIVPGPRDQRMYVADAIDKLAPYAYPELPPYLGTVVEGVPPDRFGHFDRLEPGTRGFGAAHLYATVRRVLDIWEGYAGREIPWHFGSRPLELIPFVPWDNAQSGYGFIETGFGAAPDGSLWPFAQSFDVIAHEVGHLLLYSMVGLPDEMSLTPSFGAFHEAASDMTALVALLHFDCVARRILESARGNLYVENELNRFAELSSSTEIRQVSNSLRLSDLQPDTETHAASLVLTGALFDILVEAYLLRLNQLGAVSENVVASSRALGERSESSPELSAILGRALDRRPELFLEALRQARDFLGERLALSWLLLPAPFMTFRRAAGALLEADALLTGHRGNWPWLASSFAWRGIRPEPPRQARPGLARPPLRRVTGVPEPFEMQHRCHVRSRRGPIGRAAAA